MRKLLGGGALPPKAGFFHLFKGFLGGTLGILLLGYLSQLSGEPWLMAPLGATCVLLFAVSASPLAQPRNVIGGHLLTAAIGIAALHLFGDALPVLAIAVGLSIFVMQYTRTVHPPAGANPVVIMLAGHDVGWHFMLTPVLAGSVALVVIASVLNNLGKANRWPHYWHGLGQTKE